MHPPAGLTNQAVLRTQLVHLGVRAGDVLMLHVSMRRLGPVEGGADGLIDALRASVGNAGTLVMVLDADPDEPFDPDTTPVDVEDMGIVAEIASFKRHHRVPIRDLKREREVLADRADRASRATGRRARCCSAPGGRAPGGRAPARPRGARLLVRGSLLPRSRRDPGRGGPQLSAHGTDRSPGRPPTMQRLCAGERTGEHFDAGPRSRETAREGWSICSGVR